MQKSNNVKSNTLVLFDIDDVLFNTEHFINTNLTQFQLYEEVNDVLKAIAETAEIGILSQGELSFQKMKLSETGIHDLFSVDHTHIVMKKDESLKEVLNIYIGSKKRIFYVDDRLQGLYHAKNILPHLTTIWFRRGRYKEIQEFIADFTPDIEIQALRDIIPVINR